MLKKEENRAREENWRWFHVTTKLVQVNVIHPKNLSFALNYSARTLRPRLFNPCVFTGDIGSEITDERQRDRSQAKDFNQISSTGENETTSGLPETESTILFPTSSMFGQSSIDSPFIINERFLPGKNNIFTSLYI